MDKTDRVAIGLFFTLVIFLTGMYSIVIDLNNQKLHKNLENKILVLEEKLDQIQSGLDYLGFNHEFLIAKEQ